MDLNHKSISTTVYDCILNVHSRMRPVDSTPTDTAERSWRVYTCPMKAHKRQLKSGPQRSVRDLAYAHIQAQIAGRTLRAGMALSEVALAKELGISRTPVREAIGQLASEGLLEQTPNRGAVVVRLTRRDIVELYELREALEVFAVGKAAGQKLRSSDLDRLRSLADEVLALRDEMKKGSGASLNSEQMHRFAACDLAFHSLLMRIAANSRMLKVVNETRLLIRIFGLMRRGHSRQDLERISNEHRAIADTLGKGDRGRVMQLLAAHIQASQQERLDEFDYWEHEESLRETQISLSSFPALASDK